MKHVLLNHPGGAPPCLSEQEMLVLACSVLQKPQDCLCVCKDLQVVMLHHGGGRYSYVCFDENGEMEVFHPRDFNKNPRRVL